jgi:hypothetical protein
LVSTCVRDTEDPNSARWRKRENARDGGRVAQRGTHTHTHIHTHTHTHTHRERERERERNRERERERETERERQKQSISHHRHLQGTRQESISAVTYS